MNVQDSTRVDVSKKNLGRLDGEGGGENGGCASVCSSKFLISIYFRQNER